MSQDEIHEKSPVETVGMFFAWMARKAKNDNDVVRGEIGGVVYEVGPDFESLGKAFDKYLQNSKHEFPD